VDEGHIDVGAALFIDFKLRLALFIGFLSSVE
jgi:hypothetical protein